MVSPNAVRCINRERNKVQYFSKAVVNDPRWRKMTGYEPQPLEAQRSIPLTEPAPFFDMEAEVARRVAAELEKADKPKRKYTKKQKA